MIGITLTKGQGDLANGGLENKFNIFYSEQLADALFSIMGMLTSLL